MGRFQSADSKLEWAHEHLTTLGAKLRQFREAYPYRGVVEDHPNFRKAIRLPLGGAPKLPNEFKHRIGEFATALRASMDHLVWGLMAGTPKNPNRIQFPIFDSKSRYDAEWPKQLSGLVAGAEPIIAGLQPYHAARPHADPLWRIHRLSNTDKHRTIVLAPYAMRMSSGLTGGQRMGLTMTFADTLDEDPVIPLPPDLIEVGRHFNFQVETLFAVVLQNADADTGIFMPFEELPALYDHVRNKVFPPLKALIP